MITWMLSPFSFNNLLYDCKGFTEDLISQLIIACKSLHAYFSFSFLFIFLPFFPTRLTHFHSVCIITIFIMSRLLDCLLLFCFNGDGGESKLLGFVQSTWRYKLLMKLQGRRERDATVHTITERKKKQITIKLLSNCLFDRQQAGGVEMFSFLLARVCVSVWQWGDKCQIYHEYRYSVRMQYIFMKLTCIQLEEREKSSAERNCIVHSRSWWSDVH